MYNEFEANFDDDENHMIEINEGENDKAYYFFFFQ